jgi:branched-chain amino acid transport system ATP-binding protein
MVNILKMLAEKGSSILVVSHEIGVVSRLCERVAVLDRGVKIAEGTLREVALVQEVRRAYLGI